MTDAAPQVEPTDLESIAAILEQAGVRTRLEDPSWTEYLAHLFQVTLGRIFERFVTAVESVADAVVSMSWLGRVLLAVSLLALVVLVVRELVLWRRRRQVRQVRQLQEEGETGPATDGLPTKRLEAWAPARWRQEIERYVDAGDIPGALAQVWWWLATTLRGERVDPSWTSRELVLRAQRRDLLSVAGDLDRLAFGPGPTGEAEVRSFVTDLESRLRGSEGAL